MNAKELKAAIAEDIETLKHLDLDIMDERTYYGEIRLLILKIFLMLWLPTCVSGAIYLWTDWAFFIPQPIYNSCAIVFIPAIISFVFAISIFGLASEVVIFKHQLKPILKTGDYLYSKACQIWKVPYLVILACLFLITPCIGWYAAGGVEFFACLVASGIISVRIQLEASRIGVSVLFGVIKQFFESRRAFDGSKYDEE